MKVSVRALVATFVLLGSAPASAQIFVGSWRVDAGPSWTTVPQQYSGLDAAALLFGGVPTDYFISTVDNNPLNINFMAWYTVWNAGGGGDPACTGFPCGQMNAENFTNGFLYQSIGDVTAYSQDWAVGAEFTNYAFLRSSDVVPEPATMTLLATGLAGMAAARRRKRTRA